MEQREEEQPRTEEHREQQELPNRPLLPLQMHEDRRDEAHLDRRQEHRHDKIRLSAPEIHIREKDRQGRREEEKNTDSDVEPKVHIVRRVA